MRAVAALAIAFALSAAPASAQGPVLWQNVEAGMTPAQVMQAQPRARPMPPVSLGNGSMCQASLTGYRVSGLPFNVNFCFSGMALDEVMLEQARPATDADYKAALFLLRDRYGRESARDDAGKIRKVEWQTPDGLGITLFAVIGTRGILNIVYQPIADPSGADRL